MSKPEQLESVGNIAFVRLKGPMSLASVGRQAIEAIVWAREQNIPNLLLNVRGIEGLVSPNLAERYFLMREFAAAAQGRLKLAVVIAPQMMDPERFGVTVARNAGLTGDAFADEADAIAWLQAADKL